MYLCVAVTLFCLYTATTNFDYSELPTNVEFQQCKRRLCVPLFILDDDVMEGLETITISVRSGTPRHDRLLFSSHTTQIEITDNDCKCCISRKILRKIYHVCYYDVMVRLRNTYIATSEATGSVVVCAVLEEGISVAFSVVISFILGQTVQVC